MWKDRHSQSELFVFKEFAAACPLDLNIDAAEKMQPPAPDIRCPLASGNLIDFELVDGTFPETKAKVNQSIHFDPQLKDAFKEAVANGRIDSLASWSGLSVMVDFRDTSARRRREQAISPIIDFLARQGPNPVRTYQHDIPAVSLIHIHNNEYADWDSHGPSIRTQTAHFYASAVPKCLEKKLRKSYKSPNAVHLLVHCDHGAPVSTWRESATTLLEKRMADSSFNRVWVYNRSDRAITFSYPS